MVNPGHAENLRSRSTAAATGRAAIVTGPSGGGRCGRLDPPVEVAGHEVGRADEVRRLAVGPAPLAKW
jgi:hypothetical protein